jgi:general secretion pathway protein G
MGSHGLLKSERLTRGFTLVELLVVMAIIGLLLSIVAPRYIGTLERSKETALKQDLVVMREAISNFHHDLNRYPENLEELVQKKYLRTIPVDPITDRSDMWVSVYSTDSSEPGLVDVTSGAQGATNDGVPFEQL